MLTIILCLVAAVHGQYPYPPPAPEGDSLLPEGPYPSANAIEVPRAQPAVLVQPTPSNTQTVIGEIPRAQPVFLRKKPIQPYPAQLTNRYEYGAPKIEVRPVAFRKVAVENPFIQPYVRAQQENRYPQPQTIQPTIPVPQPQPLTTFRTLDSPYPAAQAQKITPFAAGGELSPGELEAPDTRYGLPRSSPTQSGGELSPEELELPPNTQVNLQDKRLQYSHGFSDDKGTQVREQGSLLSTNDGWEYVIAKKGSYSYVSPEGTPITVNYIADDKGYRVLPN